MRSVKGFTLLEVVLSLFLLSVLCLALLEQQRVARQSLSQLKAKLKAVQGEVQQHEFLFLGSKNQGLKKDHFKSRRHSQSSGVRG